MEFVHGHCDESFQGVRQAFAGNFEHRGEVGAAVAVWLDGRLAVDLWAGMADPAADRPWESDTLAVVFSVTKALTSLVTLLLWQEGRLDIDAPIAELWPEFGRSGKHAITIRHVLTHSAGLPAFDEPVSFEDCFDAKSVEARLAGQRPRWNPGEAHGYHAMTFGTLVDGVVRRASGRSVADLVRARLAVPLDLDLHLGLSEADDARTARVLPIRFDLWSPAGLDAEAMAFIQAMLDPSSLTSQVFANPPGQVDPDVYNSRPFLGSGLAGAAGVANARSLAVLFGHVAAGDLLSDEVLTEAVRTQVSGHDRVLVNPTSFGLGFSVAGVLPGRRAGDGCFGHEGANGCIAFGDRRLGLGFAYVLNQPMPDFGRDLRATALTDAVHEWVVRQGR